MSDAILFLYAGIHLSTYSLLRLLPLPHVIHLTDWPHSPLSLAQMCRITPMFLVAE